MNQNLGRLIESSAFRKSRMSLGVILVALLFSSAHGQQKKPSQSQTDVSDDVIRVSTDLVQTGVTVLNKSGHFVDNLSRDDFEIRIDGKPQPISFFELVKNSAPRSKSTSNNAAPSSIDENIAGRSVIFFIDDLHLSSESVGRTHTMLEHFIDEEMGDEDEAVIASASGQIGFLQQLTDNKDVLKTALSRLRYRATAVRDSERPPMTEYQAFSVENNDEEVIDHYVSILLSEMFSALARINPAQARSSAERLVRSRARRILAASTSINRSTLASLQNLVRSLSQFPGRKLVVFISDGFLQNNQDIGIAQELREITDAALRAGVVIYAIQASGLNTAFPDASSSEVMDPDLGTGRAPLGEDSAMQAPLVELGLDTGGRALLNANDLQGALRRTLAETSQYYLLGWRPDSGIMSEQKFHRIEVSLKNHADLSARIHRGFFSEATRPSPNTAVIASSPEEQLRHAIAAVYLKNTLPTDVKVEYQQTSAGPALMVLTQAQPIGNDQTENNRAIEVAGVVLNDQGQTVASFGNRATASDSKSVDSSAPPAFTSINQLSIKPGLYQVRVATRDTVNGFVGRATDWIQVPDLSSGKLTLSSLFIGERNRSEVTPRGSSDLVKAQLKIDNRFSNNSWLRLFAYIYNAVPKSTNNSAPRLEVQIQILHHHNLLMSSPPRQVQITSSQDLNGAPFAEELSLAQLSRGRYTLRVTVTDGKRRASRETFIQVD